MEKKLYRNEHNKMIAGVCSGLADYMGTDVTIIRILAVLLIFFGVGAGIPIYIIMWLVIPVNSDPTARMREFNDYFSKQDPNMFNSANAFNNAGNSDTSKWNTPNETFNKAEYDPTFFKKKDHTGRTILGLILLVIGVYSLMRVFHVLPFWFSLGKMWPLALIIVGVAFISRSKRDREWEDFKSSVPNEPIVNPTPADITPETPESDNDAES